MILVDLINLFLILFQLSNHRIIGLGDLWVLSNRFALKRVLETYLNMDYISNLINKFFLEFNTFD